MEICLANTPVILMLRDYNGCCFGNRFHSWWLPNRVCTLGLWIFGKLYHFSFTHCLPRIANLLKAKCIGPFILCRDNYHRIHVLDSFSDQTLTNVAGVRHHRLDA
jgi:hypothetical protein